MHRACLVGWLVVDDGMDEGWTRADDGVNASNNKSYNFCEMPPESFVTVSYCAVTSDFLAWSTPTHTRTVTGCTQGGVSCKSHGNGIERPRKFFFSRSHLFTVLQYCTSDFLFPADDRLLPLFAVLCGLCVEWSRTGCLKLLEMDDGVSLPPRSHSLSLSLSDRLACATD